MPGFSSSNTNNYYSILTLWYSPNDSKVEFYWVWSKRFFGQSIMSRGVAGGGGALVSCCVTRRPAELTKTHQDLLTRLVAAGPPHRNGLSSCSQLFSHLSHYPLLATRFFQLAVCFVSVGHPSWVSFIQSVSVTRWLDRTQDCHPLTLDSSFSWDCSDSFKLNYVEK